MTERWRLILPGIWLGCLLAIAGIATPAPFATLIVADAARVVARILEQEAWLSVVLSITIFLLERRRAGSATGSGAGSVVSLEMLLALGGLFCTLTGYFAIQPLMTAARAGQSALSFGQLHMASTVFYGIKCMVVAGLTWRTALAARL